MPDFSLSQIPSFAQSALGGFQAGQAMGRQQLVQSALSGVDLTRPETITPLLKVDPEHGIALLGASSAMLKNEREIAARSATTDYLTARYAPKPASSVSTDGGTVATAGPADAAWASLVKADPDGAFQLRQHLDQMDDTQRKRLVEAQDALHEVAAATADLPYAQRKAYIASQREYLGGHYVTPEQINGFDPTDQNLHTVIAEALGVKGVVDMHDKAAARTETARHNRASEGTAAGNLDLSRRREVRVTKWGPQAATVIMGGVPSNTDDLDY